MSIGGLKLGAAQAGSGAEKQAESEEAKPTPTALAPEGVKLPAGEPEQAEIPVVVYSSGRIPNFRYGRFQFTKGQLTLPVDQAAEFEEFLEKAPIQVQTQITKIDVAGALKALAEYDAQNGGRISGVDTAGFTAGTKA